MAKYKVGDEVWVRTDLMVDERYGGMAFLKDMAKLCGKVVTIQSVHGNQFYKVTGYGSPFFTDEMFNGLASEKEEASSKFKVGDRVSCIEAHWGTLQVGDLGTVIIVRDYDFGIDYGIEFDNEVKGHDCEGKGKDGHCWWMNEYEIELAKDEPKPEPTPITVNITVNLYENACWYCRKGGLVDLYLAGAMGICPSCKRVYNATNYLPKSHKPSNPWKKENKPLTNEELEALADGTRVFVLFKKYEDGRWTVDDWKSSSTCWRTKQGNILNRKHGHVMIDENNIAYTAYLEEPERH